MNILLLAMVLSIVVAAAQDKPAPYSVKGHQVSLTNPTYCAQSEVHTYDDAKTKWDFTGRNAFYGSYEYVSQ